MRSQHSVPGRGPSPECDHEATWSWTSRLQNYEGEISVGYKPPNLCYLLEKPEQTKRQAPNGLTGEIFKKRLREK